jgi:membrane protease YdiL (CAAX protease family)
MPLVALGAFGPLIGAVLASRREGGGAGVRAIFASLRVWRVNPVWYGVALFGLGAIYVAGTATYRLFGGQDAGQWLYPPENAAHLAALILFPIAEEPGWRGFAQPRLQERYGALRASLLIGVVWTLWHTMMFVTQGMTPLFFAVSCANLLAGSVVFTWLYNHTRGSLLLAILLHAGAHLNNPTRSVPDKTAPFVVYTVALCVAALALWLFDRRATREARAPLSA